MFQTKVVQEIKTHILCSVTSFPRKSRRLWDNVEHVVQPDRPQITIQYHACVLHAGYIRLQIQTDNITAFTQQKCLRECGCILRHMYCLLSALLLSSLWKRIPYFLFRSDCRIKILYAFLTNNYYSLTIYEARHVIINILKCKNCMKQSCAVSCNWCNLQYLLRRWKPSIPHI
jgi:hypothetical protein